MSHEGLSPTTRNILALVSNLPVMFIRRDPSSRRAEKVFEELMSLPRDEFIVCRVEDGISLVRASSARKFIV